MSFNNHITLANYEEYFILYMDNELTAAEREQVEGFVAAYPHLREELELLLSTKLPFDAVAFTGKEDLLSSAMKLNALDEDLLLYVDDELGAAKKAMVAKKIEEDEDYALQHSLLMQTKLDKEEAIVYPNKKELYRRTERRLYPVWMAAAAAIVVLLSGTFLFLSNRNVVVPPGNAVVKNPQVQQPVKQVTVPQQKDIIIQQKEEPVLVKLPQVKKKVVAPVTVPGKTPNQHPITDDVVVNHDDLPAANKEIIRFDVKRFTQPSVTDERLNKNIAYQSVTSTTPDRTIDNDPTGDPDADGESKTKTKGRGFFRKVSRFIERRTGIGTVNTDNELLVGAVALKLK